MLMQSRKELEENCWLLYTKMKIKDFKDSFEIPGGVEVIINEGIFEVKGKKGSLKKKLFNPKIKKEVKDNKVIFTTKNATQREKKFINTVKAHLKNMFKGVGEGYVYRLKICASHFPMNVSVNNGMLEIKNFVGEKVPRTLKIKEGVNVKIDGTEIIVDGADKEIVGQVSADIENLTKRHGFDKRIFQDGIYIIEKDGKVIK